MIAIVTFAVTLATALAAAPEGATRCYDCSYGYHHLAHLSQAGLPQCALLNEGDAAAIDQWECKSGKCFIRLDKNGLVYRGCANPENLNLGVDAHLQCAYQGGSLYYFCKGDLCNFGEIGHLCGHHHHHHHFNPCDGKCHDNPTGLFANPHDATTFIHCGCGADPVGNTCMCCRPFLLQCPKGTEFNVHTKTCTE